MERKRVPPKSAYHLQSGVEEKKFVILSLRISSKNGDKVSEGNQFNLKFCNYHIQKRCKVILQMNFVSQIRYQP